MSRLITQLANTLRTLESYLFGGNGFPPAALTMVCQTAHAPDFGRSSTSGNAFSLRELIGDGMLWAVPKHRRTLEKRHKRKYGSPEYKLKILTPKIHLRSCATCGSDHEVGVLCPTCYQKVRKETELMQEKIQNELGLEPVDKDVVVLYDRERDEQPAEFWEGKRIVEMEKPRPTWFSKNLLQKSTQPSAPEPDELKPGHEKLG